MSTSEQTFQMLWDCKYCGQKKLLGVTHRFCGSCGAPQDAGARYFPPEGEEVAAAGHVFVGADVQCAGCAHWNSLAAKCCTNCGAPVGGRSAPLVAAPASPAAAAPAKSKGGVLRYVLAAVALLFVSFVGLVCVNMALKKEGALTVSARSWERTVEVERFTTVRSSAWCDELPAGARVVSRRDETRSTEKIADGETCTTRKKDQGDGTFKQIRECTPKYKEKAVRAPKCDFDAERWANERTARASGTDAAPAWPALSLRTGTCLGCEREGKRSERYTLTAVESGGKSHSCDTTFDVWSRFPVGTRAKGMMGGVTGSLDCSTLVKP